MVDLVEVKLEEYVALLKPAYNQFVRYFKQETSNPQLMMADVIYALQGFIDNAKVTLDAYKVALIEDMEQTGTLSLKGERIITRLVQSVPTCLITDRAALEHNHPELMRPPIPDRVAITKRLRAGEMITGASLTPGTSPHLRMIPIAQKTVSLEGESDE